MRELCLGFWGKEKARAGLEHQSIIFRSQGAIYRLEDTHFLVYKLSYLRKLQSGVYVGAVRD